MDENAVRHIENFSKRSTDASMGGRSYEALLNISVQRYVRQCGSGAYIWATENDDATNRANFSLTAGACKVEQGTIKKVLSDLCEGKDCKGQKEPCFMVDLNFQAFQAPGFDLMSVKIRKVQRKKQVEVQLFQVTINPKSHNTQTMKTVMNTSLTNHPSYHFSAFWISPNDEFKMEVAVTPNINLAPPSYKAIHIKTITWDPTI